MADISQDLNLRLTLAVQMQSKTMAEIKEAYEWITEKRSNILPVTGFQVVKQ